jgi:transcriptional regulator with XRE-family HTH domain
MKQTDTAFVDEVPRLLQERGLSLRALARQVGVSNSHLSRVLRRANYKTPSPQLTHRVAKVFGLPADYFPEFREAFVIEHIRSDPQLRNTLYTRLSRTAGRAR